MPQRDLTLPKKTDLLDQIKSQPTGTGHRRIANKTVVPTPSIGRVTQQQEAAFRKGQQMTSRTEA